MKKQKKYSGISSIIWAMKRLWKLDPKFVFFVLATVPVAVVMPLVNSLFSRQLIDSIGSGAAWGELVQIAVGFTGLNILLSLADKYVHSQCHAWKYYPTAIYQSEMVSYYGYTADYENTQKQDFKKIDGYVWRDASHGECALENIWEDVSKTLIDAFGILTFASILAVLDPSLCTIIAVVSGLSYFTTRWENVYFEKHKHLWEKEERKKEYLQRLSENLTVAKDIKLYGLEPWLERMMGNYQRHILMWKQRCSLRGVWAALLAGVMTFLQDGAAYIVLIGLLLNGKMSVGEFVFYFGLVGSIAGFLQGIVGDIAKLHSRAEKIAYYREYFDYPNVFNHGDGCELPTGPVRIELKDVWYKYDGAEDYTLKGINLVIGAGESLALVGINGAGKTTLIKLVCGLFRPTKGEILVNGHTIDEYNIEEYYSLVSAVFQKVALIAFTVFEFVASSDLSRPTAREDAVRAMKTAGIYEKIQRLENGIDTHLMKGVYDDGVELSGGEMQKLLLARAIYKDGKILVLDEPTAALDPIAENQLYLQYRSLTAGKTSIYISHRFASTRFCDRIVLLEDGVIKESGTHEELMQLNGQYAYMFGVQSQYYKEGQADA